MTSSREAIENFVLVTREFCRFLEAGDCSDLSLTYGLLAKLDVAVLQLPRVEPDTAGGGDRSVSDDEFQKVTAKLRSLPIDIYWEVLEPLQLDTSSTACGSLVDDLSDIWRDLKNGLHEYDSRSKNNAIFDWRFTFETHWGNHLTSAMLVIHRHLY